MGKISAHQFSEGGGMVTGTRNVDLARDWMRKEIEGDSCCDLGCQCRWCTFYDRKPTVEAGRIIPVPASREDGPGWYWQPVHQSKIGTRGVTHAVVWY